MPNIKHIGRIKNNKRRAIVAYRTIPNDPYSALVVLTESLPADEHDTLIKLVESPAGQQADELAIAMSRSYLPDGRNMLAGFHATGQLKKIATDQVEMTPNSQTSILLSELNEIIAKQKGVALEDLAVKPSGQQEKPVNTSTLNTNVNAVVNEEIIINNNVELTTEELAAQMRSQADAMFKEAKKLREKAEELVPTKRKTLET
jgi:hypothetical protein